MQEELEKVGQVSIHFHASQTQLSIITSSFCALVGLLLTKRNHYYFNDSIESNRFWLFSNAFVFFGHKIYHLPTQYVC